MKNVDLKIKTYYLYYFFAVLVLTEPTYLSTISVVHKFFYSLFTPIIFVFLCINTIKYKAFNKILLLIILFYFCIFFPTLLYGGQLTALLFYFLKVISFVMLINIGIKNRGIDFIKIVGLIFFLYAIINLITMIIFPKGLYSLDTIEHSWFLGHKNGLIKWLLPGFAFVSIPELIFKNKLSLKSWIYLFVIASSIIISKSSTSLVALIVLIILLLNTIKDEKIVKHINLNSSILLNFAFFVAIILLHLQNHFYKIIVNVLNKDLSFTGRNFLWDRILLYINQKPIIGHGLTQQSVMLEQMHYSNMSSHNFVLDYWYEGGILCLILFTLIIIITNIKTQRIKINNKKSLYLLYAVFFSFSIVWLTDTFINLNIINILSLIMLAYNFQLLIKDE